ncbi:sugar kinase [Wenxinia marina]|uniref:2-keto-3-deoxygluconate kinase n=1 Tax=Wenxinia marina DSM 24838 TaxID=1123501 RepID=A0A0D0QCI9_9RHOB|nr:sugar kinase [Wenxinia marina]KIQ70042.1 2-keto-3-deoxygluconate kinase [Wenxinia marina DSM 24838]GGL63073.1 2-dehydro-3-deoxygluconokinase [Wenxinia marina]
MVTVACVGEAMVELTPDNPGRQIGFAGDVLNTAIYLARGLGPAHEVAFVSVVGQDSLSDMLAAFAEAEGVSTRLLARHPTRLPGIYAIATDPDGERSFSYWRDASAARTLFENGFGLLDGFDVVYLSGITLAILPPAVRAGLTTALAGHPGQVVFDSNYRPRLWEDVRTARAAMRAVWEVTDIGLPSCDDEIALWGDEDAKGVVARLRGWGVTDGALKRGPDGPIALSGAPAGPFPPAPKVVDTTAAGDSFNGAYLAARLTGGDDAAALAAGHALASRVVGLPGAIVPREGD